MLLVAELKPAMDDKRAAHFHDNVTPSEEAELEITVTLRSCFEEISLVELISATFASMPSNQLSISFIETSIFFKQKMTTCKFHISSNNSEAAENNLESAVKTLSNQLDLDIDFSFSRINSRSQDHFVKDCRTSRDSRSLSPVEPELLRKNSAKEQALMQSKIDKRRVEVEKLVMDILQSHKGKVTQVQEKIKFYTEKESNFEIITDAEKEDKNVLSQKLKELKCQQLEFVQRNERLSSELKSLDLKTIKEKDSDDIFKAIGIECNRLKTALPIYARRKDIVNHVKSHQVSIILGETGSGKSTQLAQYMYEDGIASNGSIVCTQPRRIAAISLAERVANEMVTSVGHVVGYKTGTKKKASQDTKIFFTTDHALLNECLNDRDFSNYSCIIVDEAHERSIYTDILLGIIKISILKRPELKIIITSATIDPGVFIKYFQTDPELQVSGRTFPVEICYLEVDRDDDFEKYEEKAVSQAVEIHANEDPGDILIFLSSPVEIVRCCEEFEKRCKGMNDFKCLALHGQLQSDEQKKVFEKLPNGTRKIIFSTNCAETSVTIDGIMYVVDTGVAKEMKYDPKRNMNQLGIYAISKSSANQRKGRAGRTACGKCYRLYSKDSFEAMEDINDPEILRVHLGQAVLKLSELGINIESYDFVQAPSETALSSAIETLEYLGAIVDKKITDLGRWISKLPFDPKLGFLVYEAEKIDLLYDAVVLAAVLSSGSDLFYRGFSDSEAQVVAQSKINFGSQFGDTITWLQIYKDWSEVGENKSAWCRDRCINHKCISYAHQSIKEVKKIFARDLGVNMVEQFSSDLDALYKLRKILCRAYATSISNFSGSMRAGYFNLFDKRQVHIHPSSILLALNLQPEWLVFNNLVRTSREFIKSVTVVEVEWVRELVVEGRLSIDMNLAKENKFNSIHREEVGPTVFRILVGPRFSRLPVLEEELVNSGLSKCVIEASRELGNIDILSPNCMSTNALDLLHQMKSETVDKLLAEDYDCPLSKKESNAGSGTRVVIGSGGCVKRIFMPNQSDKVIIRRINSDISEDAILKKFEDFGEIKEIVPFKCYDPWGFVRYGSVAEAISAVEATKNDQSMSGVLKLDKHAKNVKNMFEAKLVWVRRPIKGKGTAFIKCSPVTRSQLVGRTFSDGRGVFEIKVSKKDDGDLIIFQTGSLTESEIKDRIISLLHDSGMSSIDDVQVNIARENVIDSDQDLKQKADRISLFIKNSCLIREDGFNVNMLKPKRGSINYVFFVNFSEPVLGFEACQRMKRSLYVDPYQPVEVSSTLKTTVHVPAKLKAACEERFKTIFTELVHFRATFLTWREQRKKDFVIEIKSSKPEDIIYARDLLCKELEGEVIECTVNELLKCLLNKVGQEYLQKTEKKNNCTILTDFRTGKIHMYGTEANISKTQEDINSYLSEIEGSSQGLVRLKDHNRPPGLMKLLMRKYGPLLEGLVQECQLRMITIDWKKQNISLFGSANAIAHGNQCIVDLEKEAEKGYGRGKKLMSYLPDCQVCLCSVETKESLFRLEVCGHAYCLDCVKHQVVYAINNRQFPLICGADGCDLPFVWKDIHFALSKKWIREDKLISMAINSFVLENKEKYKYCITPNCPAVYEITSDENGQEFNCPLCSASICTSCHIAFHAGITCNMAKSGAQADSHLEAWIAKDPSKRKTCPGCRIPIEKIEGCNKMRCNSCRKYFCWLCCKVCETEDECYAHLRKIHGGYF